MEDTPGLITAYGIQGWWFKTFNEDERSLMISVLENRAPTLLDPAYVPREIYDIRGVRRLPITEDLNALTGSPVSTAKHAETHAKVLEKVLEIMRKRRDIFNEHLTLSALGDAYYKLRSDPEKLELAIHAYESAVDMSDLTIQNLPFEGETVIHPSAGRLALIYTNAGRGEDALKVLFKMKAEGWRGDWDKRIARTVKKLGIPSEIVQAIESEAAALAPLQTDRKPKKRTNPKFVVPAFELQRTDLSITVDMQSKIFEVQRAGTTRQAVFPPLEKYQHVVPWYEFINFVASVTSRRGRRREGVNDWFILETSPLDLEDVSPNRTPPFTLTLLSNDPYGVNDSRTALAKALSNDFYWVEELNSLASPGGPQTASLFFYCDQNGFRKSEGYILGPGQDIWKRERSLGGIIADSDFDLYSELFWTVERGLADGFTPTGPWIGRFVTGPEDGMFEANFFAAATFEKPGFREPLWKD